MCAAFSGRSLVRLGPVIADYLDVKLAHGIIHLLGFQMA
jgi:hypothetical protein